MLFFIEGTPVGGQVVQVYTLNNGPIDQSISARGFAQRGPDCAIGQLRASGTGRAAAGTDLLSV